MKYGPTFRWFAWHPVDTKDRGWRWLIMVNRHRVWCHPLFGSYCWFDTSVEPFESEEVRRG